MKKICFITGTRAEYGLLCPLMKAFAVHKSFDLQIVATGMHLSPEFGLTYKEIEKDGFQIDEKLEMLLSSDSDTGIVKSTGLGMIGFADSLTRLKPDLVILLGDRYETFAAASAAYLLKIPIGHLHGGETTEGATDEGLRHAITKMSYWHFTSTETYKKRVIQLGEDESRVFNVGAIGIDNIKNLSFMSKEALEENLNFNLTDTFVLVTYHPVTLDNSSSENQFKILLDVLKRRNDLRIIFTKANSDADGRIINEMIDTFTKANPDKSIGFTNLGQVRYLSLMKIATAVVGNSSSGIIEAPYYGIPTVNIGDRQKGREAASSVIHVDNSYEDIERGISLALSKEFKEMCLTTENTYGVGETVTKIVGIIENSKILSLKKPFKDL